MVYPRTNRSDESVSPRAGANDSPGAAFGINPSPSFPDIERDILEFWNEDDTFAASIEQRVGGPEWVVYDGPPFANGLPHYGHLLTGYAKDLFPRFQTMRGKHVPRVFGWDTHGLPAELEAERQLGITDKSQIEAMGIAEFNNVARTSVLRYAGEWRDYVERQARWVNFDEGYKTLDVTYMESVIWAFKQLHDKGLAYEGHRVLPYCWRDQTPLSNHELRMDDDVYKMRQDQTVTVTFPLLGDRAEQLGIAGVKALAWTTTPWTLPTNLALAVGPDIDYVVVREGHGGGADVDADVERGGERRSRYLIARELLSSYASDLGYADDDVANGVEATLTGSDLVGVLYQPLFDYYTDESAFDTQRAWQILAANYVTTTDGTGIVHQAPAYGEEDQKLCEAAGIPVILSLDAAGRFTGDVPEVAGELWFDANKPLTRLIRARGRLLRQASYEHSYPHCWRCRNPLIYKAVSSWFVRVPEFRDRMMELNDEITWVPGNVKDGQFGKWLSGAREWSVSRNRYWGTPIPVWKSDDPEYPRVDVYGSLAELERDFGELPTNGDGEPDLHRPFIDQLTRPNPDDPTGLSTMRRIPDILDVWFDSGSMPFAQVHYPFENRDWFDTHNPADFVVEYIGQTRGWFYLLHVLSTALFDRPAFTNVISHGIVLGSDGQKMSKSLRNYPDVSEVFDRDGSDAMRWFLMASPVLRGGNLIVTEEGIREGVRQVLLPLWNTWYFFATYANLARDGGYDAVQSTSSNDVLDRYVLAKTHDVVARVTELLERLDPTTAAAELRDFADVLTNWYVRRSRDRFWSGVEADGTGREAFDTLYTVLEAVTRLAAPLLPLTTERIWKDLTGGRSVHLTDWPDADQLPSDDALVTTMDRVRAITGVVSALRKRAGHRVRQPLSTLTVAVPDSSALVEFEDILRDELNVKTVAFVEFDDTASREYGIRQRLTVNARAAGPRLGRAVQTAIVAAKAGDWSEQDGVVTAGGLELFAGEYDLVLETTSDAADNREIGIVPGGGFAILTTTLTPELEAEGLARDLIRAIQDARKQAAFDLSDRISLRVIFADEADAMAVRGASAVDVAAETLAVTPEGEPGFVILSPSDGVPESAGESELEQWLNEVDPTESEFDQDIAAGAFANRGRFVVRVARRAGVTNE